MTEEQESESNLDGDRFDAISAVVGQIAHDFNNLLTPLLAYPGLIKTGMPPGNPGAELLDVLEKTSRDMAHITRQLLELTTRRRFPREFLNINGVVERMVTEIRSAALVPEGVSVDLALAEDLIPVEASAERLALAFRNLCVNGIEAMGRSGRLTIETRNVQEDSRMTGDKQRLPTGKYVRVSIGDSGAGVPEDVRTRIFEPFVTTKKAGGRRGAGLGLSVAYRIAKDHGAYIDVDSAPGQGSKFSMFFPVGATAGAKGPAVTSSVAPAGSHGLVECSKTHVLLVDDEKTILKLFQMILASGLPGITVDMASNGREAVDMFLRDHHSVLIMDLHMPVMDGYAAFNEIEKTCQERHWKMPAVIFCTGFAPPNTVRNLVSASPIHRLISKPVSGDVLVEAVKARLAP